MALTRTCTKCFLQKPIEEFGWKDRSINKRHAVCKECTKKRSNDWYYQNKEHHLETVNNYTQSHRDMAREWVYQYLSTHPCKECGEADPIVLEFHHVGEKTADIAAMIGRGFSLERIKDEISRCEVLCRNCHARITAKERGWFKFRRKS